MLFIYLQTPQYVENDMKTNEILNQAYMNAKDLMMVIPNLTYDNAIKYINEVREEMKQKICVYQLQNQK